MICHANGSYKPSLASDKKRSATDFILPIQEEIKNRKLEESMRELNAEMERTTTLLHKMIPKTVADRLRKGEQPANTCQVRVAERKQRADACTFRVE